MKCKLMHKRIAVADLEMDDLSGFIQKIYRVFSPEHLPVGVAMRQGSADRAALNEWWMDRSIPASRSGIRDALEMMGLGNTKMLLIRCLGLSLSDQYWIRPDDTEIAWDDINFFEHDFSNDIGDVLFGIRKDQNDFDFSSPDNTSDGNLKKRWKIMDGKRCLMKGGSAPFRQQPFNEVVAAAVMDRLHVEHIPYTVVWDQGEPYSICEDFVTANTELVPAWRIIQTRKKPNDVSAYRHFVRCSETLGIPNVTPFLDRMIVVDYIIANEDRHFNNFGALRNAETLEWIGMAPIYDSGSSLGYEKNAWEIRAGSEVICKPFKKNHEDQLKLVSDFSWIDFNRLEDIGELVETTLSMDNAAEYIGLERIKAITDTVRQRIIYLQEYAQGQRSTQTDDIRGDVIENVAKMY